MMSELPEVDVLYQQGPCLAVWKPAGVATQAPPGIDSLETRIKQQLARAAEPGETIYLGVPHRLDRPVSGAMVFATTRKATRRLAEQFERREVQKIYWACVAGTVQPERGTWQDFMRKVPGQAHAEIVPADHPDAQLAVLHYRVLGMAGFGTWLEVALETGRTHQIRVQAAARGHAVLGDQQYGSAVPFGPETDDPRARAIALHGRQLTFRHPTTKEQVRVTAALPDYWQQLGYTFEA
jgi:23S rRNA pseudouridine1911/1915/1917 synthase